MMMMEMIVSIFRVWGSQMKGFVTCSALVSHTLMINIETRAYKEKKKVRREEKRKVTASPI